MIRQSLTKTESLIYRAFIACYLLLIVFIIGSAIYGMLQFSPEQTATSPCAAQASELNDNKTERVSNE